MEVLISGLNSYLGRAAVCLLNTPDFKVTALTRNINLLNKLVPEPVTARLKEVDLLRKSQSHEHVYVPNLAVAFYFTQVVDLSDDIHLRMELLTLNNFLEIVKRNGCNRIIYLARLMDRPYLAPIEALFKAYNIAFTIVLKASSIGYGTLLDQFFKEITTKSVLIYNPEIADKVITPLAIHDLIRWLREMPWETHFAGQIIELGGGEESTFRELYRCYARNYNKGSTPVKITLTEPLAKIAYKNIYRMNHESLENFLKVIRAERAVDNRDWKVSLDFTFRTLDSIFPNS